MLDYLGLINSALLFYVLVVGVYFANRITKIQKEKIAHDKLSFTRDEVTRIKTKILDYVTQRRSEKSHIGLVPGSINYYGNNLDDAFAEILVDLDMLCEGIINKIYVDEYVRIYLGNTIKEYFSETQIHNSISSEEYFVNIKLVLASWKRSTAEQKKGWRR